jgi:hypothetical protein
VWNPLRLGIIDLKESGQAGHWNSPVVGNGPHRLMDEEGAAAEEEEDIEAEG